MGRVYNTPPSTVEQRMSELRRDGASFVPTTDDWHPNWPGGLVKVRLAPLTTGQWRVSVWGADDTGMEKDFDLEADARQCYLSLPVVISRDDLRDLGFVWA